MTASSTEHREDDSVRFVVLLHTQVQGDHFDLMIENGPRLATWKMFQPPESDPREEIECTRIGEHRRRYLDYEGPLAGGRGRVVRHDRGPCVVDRSRADRWEIDFRGRRLRGRYRLERTGSSKDNWRLLARS